MSFGILPLRFADPRERQLIEPDDLLVLNDLRRALGCGRELKLENRTRGLRLHAIHDLSPRQVEAVLQGSLITVMQRRTAARA